MNDLIKLSENKIVFSAVLTSKEKIYIIIFNIFSDKNMKIRYYSINSFALYNYKILLDLRIHNYNNFLAFSSSFCPNQTCNDDFNEHYCALMIFSYPNSTDTEFYLDKYLFDNNNISLQDIEIDLRKLLNIENNLLGYIFSSISIKNVSQCGEYKLYSSKYEINEISNNYILTEDEYIKIKYIGSENIYPAFNCKLDYYFNATEPELDIYDIYPEEKEGVSDVGLFEKEQYSGRLTYFYIILDHVLSYNCNDTNCELCRTDINSYCIACKYDYSIFYDNV